MTVDLAVAIELHQQGRIQDAAAVYQQILQVQADHCDALHLLGVAAHQLGRHQQGVDLISRAIALRPGAPAFHNNLASAYRALGQPEQAVRSCQLALRLQPDYAEAANQLGLALLDLKRWPEAAAAFQQALNTRRDYALAANNLANALRLQGDHAGALQQYRAAAEMNPQAGDLQSNLAQMLLECNQPQEALAHSQAAVTLCPEMPEARNNHGNVLRALGRLAEAKEEYHAALRLNPRLAMTKNNMAQALQEEGRLPEALAWYQEALQIDPQSARIHANLASALAELNSHDEARTRYELALRLDPAYAPAHAGLAAVLQEEQQLAEAREHLLEAIRLKPDLAEAHCALGSVLEQTGDLAAAENAFRQALACDPGHRPSWGQLATLLRGRLPDADCQAIQELLAQDPSGSQRQAGLAFGLAHTRDAQGDHAQAAALLERANGLSLEKWARRGDSYSPAEHERFVDELISLFTPAFFRQAAGWGSAETRALFVFGLPRSGTTLTEQVLASHSQVHGAGELRLIRQLYDDLPGLEKKERSSADVLRGWDADVCRRAARTHAERLQAIDARSSLVADKMPDNYLYLGFIAAVLPGTRLVHCRRDLRDIAVSCWMTNFKQIRWANDPHHIAHRFQQYVRIMQHWAKVLPQPPLEVRYEETVADLEETARRMLDHCGLEWEPACLDFHQTQRPIRTASVAQVRQPIYQQAVARWKHYETELADLFDRLSSGER